MDREALVRRNTSMAKAFHTPSLRQRMRRSVLQLIGRLGLPGHIPKHPQRILLIRPDHLGDVLLTTPAIRALRAALPTAEIHALVGPWSADVLGRFSELDYVLSLDFPGFTRAAKGNILAPYILALRSARRLRRVGYSSAVVMRPDHWWGALLAKLAGIPERIGYDHPDVLPFLTDARARQRQHSVLQNLGLLDGWTGSVPADATTLDYPVDPLDRSYVDGYLQEWDIAPHEAIICIHPGSGAWVKQWNDDRWATVADVLGEQLAARIVFTGGDHEWPLVRRIAAQMQTEACVMAGDTNIGQLAALFARARVVLGPDSGPLHLAAAVGAATVTLFGPADPVEFAPWGSPRQHTVLTSDIACRPCRVLDWATDGAELHPCVQEITVARVLDAARRAWQYSSEQE